MIRRELVNRVQPWLLSAVALIFCSGNARADLDIMSWSLGTGVQDFSPGGGQDTRRFNTVANPFQDSHTATLGPGTATTSYDFSWSADNGFFRFDASHVTPDLGSSFYASISTGSINFTSPIPLRAHFTGAYNYSLPIPAADATMEFRVTDLQTNVNYINRVGGADTFTQPPPLTGSFAWDQTAIIPAGRDCLIIYIMRIFTTQDSGALATGSGYFQLTFEPIPEPTTLTLSSVAIALCLRRSRCRSNRTRQVRASSAGHHSVSA